MRGCRARQRGRREIGRGRLDRQNGRRSAKARSEKWLGTARQGRRLELSMAEWAGKQTAKPVAEAKLWYGELSS